MTEKAVAASHGDRRSPSPEAKGYLFWGPIALAILVTEVLGVGWVQKKIHLTIPWPTISTTIGHLGDRWSMVFVGVVGLIAAIAFHALAYRDPERQTADGSALPPAHPAHPQFLYFLPLSILPAIFAGFAAYLFVPDNKYAWGYAIYGSFAIYGVLVPSLLFFILGRKEQYPSLFGTFRSLRARRGWRWIGTVLIAGLAILVFHLALYPWPAITNAPRRYAGLTGADARSRAQKKVNGLREGMPKLSSSTQTRGIEKGHDAWLVFFSPAKGSGLKFSGCIVVVTDKETNPTPECSA